MAERSASPGAGHDPRAVSAAGGALAAQGVLRDGEQQRNVNISTGCVQLDVKWLLRRLECSLAFLRHLTWCRHLQ